MPPGLKPPANAWLILLSSPDAIDDPEIPFGAL